MLECVKTAQASMKSFILQTTEKSDLTILHTSPTGHLPTFVQLSPRHTDRVLTG